MLLEFRIGATTVKMAHLVHQVLQDRKVHRENLDQMGSQPKAGFGDLQVNLGKLDPLALQECPVSTFICYM